MTQLVIMQWKLGDLATAIVGAEKPVHKTGETEPTEEVYKNMRVITRTRSPKKAKCFIKTVSFTFNQKVADKSICLQAQSVYLEVRVVLVL